MTNSAGFTGATPTTQISRPLSMSVWVIVVRSHLTKNASSGLTPSSAPERQTSVRKLRIVRRTRAHSTSVLGSNTTHCRPRSIDCSMKISRRRTGTYL